MDVQPDPPERLMSLASWLLGQAALYAQQLVAEALGGAGLRRHHFAVLHALRQDDSISQAELGRRLSLDRSDLHAVLADLEGDALVERIPDPLDRRRNAVRITRSGTRVLARLDVQIDSAQQELLAPLSENQRRNFQRALVILVEHHRVG